VLARRLGRVGARVIPCPAIRRETISDPRGADAVVRGWNRFDRIVFTSSFAVSAFAQFARVRGLRVVGVPGRKFAAVGSETAKAIRRVLHVRVTTVPPRFTGESLARALGRVRGLRILVPRALVAREVLPRTLRRRGAVVRVLALYRTVPDHRGIVALRRLVGAGRAGWVTFASPSAVNFAMRALGRTGRRAFRCRIRAASIGPVTSRALRRWGIVPSAEAAPSTSAGLARAIVRYHRRSHGTPRR
jgi:uroporphyrinogen III methyltransferase/synthase